MYEPAVRTWDLILSLQCINNVVANKKQTLCASSKYIYTLFHLKSNLLFLEQMILIELYAIVYINSPLFQAIIKKPIQRCELWCWNTDLIKPGLRCPWSLARRCCEILWNQITGQCLSARPHVIVKSLRPPCGLCREYNPDWSKPNRPENWV